MRKSTDEELMLEVADGNVQELSILFDRYHLRIYNFYKKMTQNKALSEDLTQEVFIKILKYKLSYKSGNFCSWIFTIARNIYADYYQRNKKERTLLIKDDLLSSSDREVQESNMEINEHLQRCLLLLSEKDRELIIMHRLQEIKYEQIAEITGNSIGAIKVKMHRAMKKLKTIYFQNTES